MTGKNSIAGEGKLYESLVLWQVLDLSTTSLFTPKITDARGGSKMKGETDYILVHVIPSLVLGLRTAKDLQMMFLL